MRRLILSAVMIVTALTFTLDANAQNEKKEVMQKKTERTTKLTKRGDVKKVDAMTAARVYRGPLCPFQVIDIFEKEGLQKYEASFILKFLQNVVNTYINNRVLLSDGTEGDIIYINQASLSRPMIKSGSRFIDLSVHPELFIERIL